MKPRLLRITTVPISLKLLLQGQLSFLMGAGFEVLAVSADGAEVSSLRDQGVAFRAVNMTRKITPLKDMICLIELIRVIRDFRPDIVHTHTPKAGLLGMLAAWLCRVPVRMHTVAGLPLMESTGLKKRVLIAAEKITYACATHIYPNSVGLQQYIELFIQPRKPVTILGRGSSNGINTAHFDATGDLKKQASEIRERYGLSENDTVFSFVGRIVKDKGIGELVEAFSHLLKKSQSNPRIFLLLIGPFEQDLDPLQPEHFKFLNENKNVIMTGFQEDVRPWILASDVFVFPSYREGFPNVVMQACCLRVPCIVSDINGSNEIIRNGETGIIVPVKKHQALAEAMEMLSNNPALRKQYSENARQFVVANFDQMYVWRELLKEYRKLLELLDHRTTKLKH